MRVLTGGLCCEKSVCLSVRPSVYWIVTLFSHEHATLKSALSVGPSVHWSVTKFDLLLFTTLGITAPAQSDATV